MVIPSADWYPDPTGKPGHRRPPDTRTPPRQPWWRRKAIMIPAALLTVAVIAAAIVITSQQHENSQHTQHREPAYGPQVTLPFTGLNQPGGVAVDSAGDLYVTDDGNNRVLKLAAGWATPVVLPFTGLYIPYGVPVDTAQACLLRHGATAWNCRTRHTTGDGPTCPP
jgi:serine/threonine protein kinase, bacterial